MNRDLRNAVRQLVARGFYSAAVRLIVNETGATTDDARETVRDIAANTHRRPTTT